MRKPLLVALKRKVFSRAEMQAEIEKLSSDRFEQELRADRNFDALRAARDELEREKRLRRAAEESSIRALGKQRLAERRLAALLDRHLGLPAEPVQRSQIASDFTSDFEADRRG